MYVVIAYRWGWQNGSQYIVYAGSDKTKALALAQSEASDRGGKYGCAVYEFDADGTDYRRIGYFPSAYDEDKPVHNHRLDYLQSLGILIEEYVRGGQALVPDPDDERMMKFVDVGPAPQWLVDEVKRRSEQSRMIEEVYAQAEARVKDGEEKQA